MKLRLILSVVIVSFSGCSLTSGIISQQELQVDIKNAPRSSIDAPTKRYAEALQHYLVGQLSLGAEDTQSALASFKKVSELSDSPSSIVSGKLADLYLGSGEIDKALRESEQAIVAVPSDPGNYILKAGILSALNRNAEAIPVYEKALSLDPKRLDAAVILSLLLSLQGKEAQALSVLENIFQLLPNDPTIAHFLGRARERRGDLTKALEIFQTASREQQQNPATSLDTLRVLLKLGRVKEAGSVCRQLLASDPQNVLFTRILDLLQEGPNGVKTAGDQISVYTESNESIIDARLRLAMLAVERRNFEDAVREFQLVLAAEPRNSQARYYLGSLYAGAGRKKEAVVELFKIAPDQELYVKARTFAAFVLRQDRKLVEAESAVREALKLEPENKNILSYLILILRDAKKFEEAEVLMAKAVEEDPTNDKLLLNYGILLRDMKKDAESQSVMEKVIQLNPRHSDALNYLAYGLAEKDQDLDRALELISSAIQIRPNDSYYLDTYGWILFRRGSLHEAEEALSRAASVLTDDIVIQEHYADVLIALKKYDQALEVLRAALERGRDVSDKEQAEALERIEKKLDGLVRQYPEISAQQAKRQ